MIQADDWKGRVGQAWAAEWQRTDRAFSPLSRRLADLLAQIATDRGRAIDIGCGAGETSLALADLRPELSVTGVDLSEELIGVARTRAGSRANVAFHLGDAAQVPAAPGSVDLFVSRHGVMFFEDPVAAFSAFRLAAAPGARLIFTCFRSWRENRFASDVGDILGEAAPPPRNPGPFAFADEAHVRSILGSAGWRESAAEPVDFAFRTGDGPDPIADAMSFLTRIGPAARALRDAPEAERGPLLDALANACAARLADGTVDFPAAAWLWTATAQ
jgi:SAM-dependent methyltransferase